MTLLISVLQATNIKYKGQLLFRRTGLWPNQPIFQWNPHHIGYSASPTLMITITSDVVVGCWRSSSSERHTACCLVQLPRKCLLPDLIDRRSAHTHRRRSTATTRLTPAVSRCPPGWRQRSADIQLAKKAKSCVQETATVAVLGVRNSAQPDIWKVSFGASSAVYSAT